MIDPFTPYLKVLAAVWLIGGILFALWIVAIELGHALERRRKRKARKQRPGYLYPKGTKLP